MPHTDAPPPPPGTLERTLRERLFRIEYQPIVELKTKRTFAYEGLVRATEYPSPPALILDAVRHGRLGELGRALRDATVAGCLDAPLFVNIHPDELVEHYLVQPDDPIFTHGEEVFLELTEAVPMQRLDICAAMLAEIQARGVFLVVDDLGSGYSNLRYIADLNPRVVKLDRELVTGLRPDTRRFKLVRNLVNMCNDLGALVVAECIETPEELDAAIAAGCHLGQGYVFARPAAPPPAFTWPLAA